MEVGGGGGGSSQARDVGAVDGSHRGWFVALQGRELQGKGGERELRQTGGVYTLGSVVRSAASSIWPKH